MPIMGDVVRKEMFLLPVPHYANNTVYISRTTNQTDMQQQYHTLQLGQQAKVVMLITHSTNINGTITLWHRSEFPIPTSILRGVGEMEDQSDRYNNSREATTNGRSFDEVRSIIR